MVPAITYLNRERAAEFLTAKGIELTAQALADMAYRGISPTYAIVRGRAVYTEAWLLEWIEKQVSQSVTHGPCSDRPERASKKAHQSIPMKSARSSEARRVPRLTTHRRKQQSE